ncbi:MAG: 4-(cytidine 5'-diphospho)-2-C-methyl-D-erythritol kinase, partial [Oscillospiraceae bacterium]
LLDNGYHVVDMVMQAVAIYERVEVAKSMGYALRCPGSAVPANEKNTATKAAAAFFYHTGLLAGADITVHKTVPTRAGMAGGSADAAAVLVGLNALYKARLSREELCAIGREVGADVPFSLVGGTARVRGIGDEVQPLRPLPACWLAVAMPVGGVSTPVAYRRFDEMGSPLHPDIGAACAAIEAGRLEMLAPHMQNMLEHANGDETTARLRGVMDEAGALASMMTGSGAAVFGLFATEAAARAAAKAAEKLARQVFVARPVATGPVVVEQS